MLYQCVRRASNLRNYADWLKQYLNVSHYFNILASDEHGCRVLTSWIGTPLFKTQDDRTLAHWTNSLVELTQACLFEHDVPELMTRWRLVCNAVASLQTIVQRRTREHTAAVASLATNPPLYRPSVPKMPYPDLTQDPTSLEALEKLQLQVPEFDGKLDHTIQILSSIKTPEILQEVMATFPCKICKGTLDKSHAVQKMATSEVTLSGSEADRQTALKFLGREFECWKVLLSAMAKTSIEKYFGKILRPNQWLTSELCCRQDERSSETLDRSHKKPTTSQPSWIPGPNPEVQSTFGIHRLRSSPPCPMAD